MNKTNPVVELVDASIYQKDKLILESVNLNLYAGEFAYLVGRTGTGKTSLLKTLYGDLPLKHGWGKVAGFDLTQLNWRLSPYLRRKLGIVFQDFHLLMDRNVEDNLRFALEATEWRDEHEIDKRITNVLANVDTSHKRFAMPYELSGGEQQRIVIARALLNDPVLILADEPTGNLDPKTSEDIIGLLQLISRETDTMVLVGTHDFYTIERFPAKMLTCIDKKIVEGYKM
ncbi:MAG: cell division ATP-binding protein FtsE [Chitinophagales bacterium]